MMLKQGKSVIWLFLKTPLTSITISMEGSRRDLFINMADVGFIFKNNPITLFPCFFFIDVGLPKTWVSFHCGVTGSVDIS